MTSRVLAIVESIAHKDYAKAEGFINGELSVKALTSLREHKKEFGARIMREGMEGGVSGAMVPFAIALKHVSETEAKSPDKNEIVNGHSWIEAKTLSSSHGPVTATGAMKSGRAPFTKEFTNYAAFRKWATSADSNTYDIKFATSGKGGN